MGWLADLAVPLLGSAAGAYASYKTTSAAQKQIEQSNQQALVAQDRMVQQIREASAPQSAASAQALARLKAMAGIEGTYDFTGSPGYGFALDQGLQAIERARSAGGNLSSGRTWKEAGRFANGLALRDFNNEWARIAQLAGLGAPGATAQFNAYGNTGTNLANLYSGFGTNQASIQGAYNQGVQGSIQNVLTAFNQSRLLDRLGDMR